jgi:hypothetical protein
MHLLSPQWTNSTATTAAAAATAAGSYDILEEGVQAGLCIVVINNSYQGIGVVDLRRKRNRDRKKKRTEGIRVRC